MSFAIRVGALILAGAAIAWLAGFVWFVDQVSRPAAAAPGTEVQKADGIVVLTGGAERIATGLRLLQQGCCERLLISGVGAGADLPALRAGAGADPLAARVADSITLGRSATSTAGNADETAAWAHENHLHSLLVVTAYYHMPRALFELSRTAPDLRLIPVPVQPGAARPGISLPMLSRLAVEYSKFIASAAGLTVLEHAPETVRAGMARGAAARHDRA